MIYWRNRHRRWSATGFISARAISTRRMCSPCARPGIRLGISTHDDAELVRALTFAPDYVALGPIYPTSLKAMAFAPQGLERIGEWKRRIGAIPLVAIGGLDCRAGEAVPRGRRRRRLRRHRHHAERRSGGAGARMDGGDAGGVTQRLPIALTIAGSDSGGGAGIQADLKTFAAFGVYAASVVTALTAQNTRGVRAIHYPPPGIVGAQIEAVLEDFAVAAIKIGMLGSAEIANVVAERLPCPHPSPRSASGDLSSRGGRRHEGPEEGLHRLRSGYGRLLWRSAERRWLRRSGRAASCCRSSTASLPISRRRLRCSGSRSREAKTDMARQGEALLKLGPRAVLMKGGHLEGDEAVDLLVTEDAMCIVSRRRGLLPKTCTARAARSRAPSPPTSFSALPCRRLLRRPRRSSASRSSVAGMSRWARGAGPLIQTELRSKL